MISPPYSDYLLIAYTYNSNGRSINIQEEGAGKKLLLSITIILNIVFKLI